MIWRLMATILAVSDTGSISLVATHSDWPNEAACRQILQSHYTTPPPTIFNGHEVTAKISASCVLVGNNEQAVIPPPPVRIPPPIANLMPRFFGEYQRFGPDGLPCGSLTCGND